MEKCIFGKEFHLYLGAIKQRENVVDAKLMSFWCRRKVESFSSLSDYWRWVYVSLAVQNIMLRPLIATLVQYIFNLSFGCQSIAPCSFFKHA